jgi:lysylphosphatidylglycerol synthetase-like protein (DUF2156 family)
MVTLNEGSHVDELLLHFNAQRDSAIRLIQKHNQLLSRLLGSADVLPAIEGAPHLAVLPVAAAPHAAASAKGKVISLFDYSKPPVMATLAESIPAIDYHILKETDPDAMTLWAPHINALLEKYGADDALAINRKYQASTIFVTSRKDGLFYFKTQSGVMFVVCFVGSANVYADALRELKTYADANQLQINIMAMDGRVADLKASGFSTTPVGIWQRVEPLAEFTLEGSAMRRLRYMVSKYSKMGVCKTIEYAPGTQPDVDEAICTVIDQWVALKAQNIPYTTDVKVMVRKGGIGADHRFFLTWRGDVLDNVIVFSRDNFNNGYLMDLEFYSKDMPLGSTEFALNEIIEIFKKEGRQAISLGLTMGTELFEHENGSKEVEHFFEQLKKANYLNGDANAQYKSKYRPKTVAMYLARPEDCGKKKLNDLVMLLGSAN